MSGGELTQAVQRRGWAGLTGIAIEITLNVVGEVTGRLVSPSAVFLQRTHHDPIQLAAQFSRQRLRIAVVFFGDGLQCRAGRTEACARSGGLLFSDDPPDFIQPGAVQSFLVEWCRPGEQLVQHDSQRIDIRSRVDVLTALLCLLGTHVQRRADDLGRLRVERSVRQRLMDSLGDAEVDHFGDGRHRQWSSP